MDRRRRRPAQEELVGVIPPVLPIRLLAGLPPDLEGAPHRCPPAASSQAEGLHPPTRPQPQRSPPPRQTKLAVAGPAELVTCDQTIERSVGRLKQFRRVATRYDKRAANYLAWATLAAALTWPSRLADLPEPPAE
jgi:transposase